MANEGETLSIVSYNINLGGKHLPQIIRNFKENEKLRTADIVCLQEASLNKVLDAQAIAETLGSNYEFTNIEAQKAFGVMQAIAVIYNRKRLDLISSEAMELPTLPTYMYLFYLPLVGKAKFDRRICLIQSFIFEGKLIRIYNTHLDVRGGWKLKAEQMETIMKRIDSLEKADLEVFCGGLNTANVVPERFSNKERFFKTLRHQLSRRNFMDVSSEIKWTFCLRNINPRTSYYEFFRLLDQLKIKLSIKRKIDYIFTRTHSRTFKVNPAVALEIEGSDHLPLVLKIDVKI